MLNPDVVLEEPENLSGLISLLSQHGDEAKLIAGGTDIVVDMKNNLTRPPILVSLARVKGLSAVEQDGSDLVIGAMVSCNTLAQNVTVRRRLPALAEAARSMGSYQIRNLATVGGNLCSASPSADLPPTLIAASARIIIHSSMGETVRPLRGFFLGPRATTLKAGEVLSHIIVPAQPQFTGISYQVFKLREANALAVASSAVRLTLDTSGKIKEAMVVLGAVAPIPMMAEKTVDLLVGEKPSSELFAEAALQASAESKPINDVRGTIEHRKALVKVLSNRALDQALGRAKANGE